MCGIVGYIGGRPTIEVLLDGLQRLEYRGYDSAGVAIGRRGAPLAVFRATGKLANLRQTVALEIPRGTSGIGHTRWATHGKPSENNAHPHIDCDAHIAVVHNGIVENHAELRAELVASGHQFKSDTDTEVLPHLVESYMDAGDDLEAAALKLLGRVTGALAMVIMVDSEPERLVAARVGNAGGVVVGVGDGEMYIASDLPAIIPYTRQIIFLESMQLAVLDRTGVVIRDASGTVVPVSPEVVQHDPVSAARGGYKHFMLKEIMEQPAAITDTLRHLVDLDQGTINRDAVPIDDEVLRSIKNVVLIGMGTSLHPGQCGRIMIEALAQVPAYAENASEFRYRNPIVGPDTLVVSISQSGETVDTLAAMEEAKHKGAPQLTICNVEGSQTTRVAGGAIMMRCGPEIGVASTKTLTAAMLCVYVFSLKLAAAVGKLDPAQLREKVRELVHIPLWMSQALESHKDIEKLAHSVFRRDNFLFLGRGISLPVAMEGALKLKEISYIHAEGYPAGEMKHGPIALIDENMPVVALALRDELYRKNLNNIEESRARDARVIAIATVGDDAIRQQAEDVIYVPDVPSLLSPLVSVIPLQLLAYEIAVRRGCDVDQPRNLAKTVTVE